MYGNGINVVAFHPVSFNMIYSLNEADKKNHHSLPFSHTLSISVSCRLFPLFMLTFSMWRLILFWVIPQVSFF